MPENTKGTFDLTDLFSKERWGHVVPGAKLRKLRARLEERDPDELAHELLLSGWVTYFESLGLLESDEGDELLEELLSED